MIHKTTRSILSVLLAALLLVTSTPLTPAFAGGGGVSLPSESGEGPFAGGTGTADDPYQIATAEELWAFAEKVNGGETDASAVLTAEIDLNPGFTFKEDGSYSGPDGEEPHQWTPIGNSIGNSYRGTFNGAGHTISGLYINNSTADYRGLFGYVGSEGTVQNLTVSGDINGNRSVGGVVGYNGGTVENCHNIGEVSGNRYVGGVVGENGGSVTNCYNTGTITGTDDYAGGVVGYNDRGRVENCYNTGKVSGNSYVGGVVGSNRGTVENCYNTGTVTGTDDYVGGVVGYNSGSVTNCYNTGDVSGKISVGGVVGYNYFGGSVTNCYNTGTVTGPDSGNSNQVGGVVGRNDSGTVKNCYNTGSVTSSGSPVGGVVGLNDNGTVTDCYFLQQDPAIDGIGNDNTHTGATVVDNLTDQDQFKDWDFIDTWRISQSQNRPVLQDNAQDGLPPGLGTKASPYQISTATQLKNFATAVNGGIEKSAHAKLMNNIDLSSVCSKEKGNWTPIGTSEENAYTGTFDGNGHKIENLYINTTYSGADNQGLFGFVGTGGTVQNLTVSGNVSGDLHVGGVVGYNNGGTVTGCIFSGSGSVSVTGSYYVGGVVGENNGSVINCYNTSSVTGVTGVTGSSDSVGGVVGDNGGSVTNCYNTGTVTGTGTDDYPGGVGGVVGDNGGTVENCYNTGSVTSSSSDSVGGVVGWNDNGTVTNCYNTGEVSGSGSGGIVGNNNGSAIVTNCYYQNDKASAGIGGSDSETDEAIAKDEAEFHSGEVAYLLQSNQTDESGLVWGQTLGGEEDSLPTLVALNPGAAQPVYKVTFKYGYDSVPENEISYTNGSVKFPTFERTGYTFAGWTPTGTTISQDTTFTAQWTANTYTVTLHTNDGTIAEDQNVTTYTYGIGATLPTTVTREGYTFEGWYEKEDLTGDPVTEIGKDAMGDKIYWAKWEEVENPEPEPTPTPTPTPDPEPSGPSTGDSTGWDDILDELENTANGDQITIDMGDETKVPAEIFETLAGQDITLEIALEGGVTWTVNGQDIPADANLDDLDLGVEMNSDGIPANVINTITGEVGTVQITLAHDGEFGFTMTLTAPLGKENAGYWANLYHYDESAEAMNFEAAAKIDEDGSVTIPFSHASQYAIVIDTHSHATVDVSDLFIDIAPDAWYKDAVQYAYDNGLMTGVSDTEFAPEATTTRAMIVSILARLEGVESAQAAGFADVDNDWYATAVNWAANVGVVNGYEDNTFRPNTAITREQLAAILMNYASYKGEDVSNRASLANYTDQPSTWATEAMSWAVAEGLISGVTNDELQPQGNATRAQVAAILQRLLEA